METRTQLHEVRQQRGVSVARLAQLTEGVSRQTIYAIEAGDYVPNTTLALQLANILEVHVEDLFQIETQAGAMPAPIAVELIGGPEKPRKGQPVQLCRVGKRTMGVSADPQPLMLPLADGVIVEGSKRKQPAEVRVFQPGLEEGKRLLVAGGCAPGISLLAQHLGRFDDVGYGGSLRPPASRRSSGLNNVRSTSLDRTCGILRAANTIFRPSSACFRAAR